MTKCDECGKEVSIWKAWDIEGRYYHEDCYKNLTKNSDKAKIEKEVRSNTEIEAKKKKSDEELVLGIYKKRKDGEALSFKEQLRVVGIGWGTFGFLSIFTLGILGLLIFAYTKIRITEFEAGYSDKIKDNPLENKIPKEYLKVK